MQACSCICPSPQSSLTTGPRFIETWGMTAGGRYMTREKRVSLCGTKSQQGLVAWCKPCFPGWKVAHWLEGSLEWGVWEDAHHRVRAVTEACIRRASSTLLEQTAIFLVEIDCLNLKSWSVHKDWCPACPKSDACDQWPQIECPMMPHPRWWKLDSCPMLVGQCCHLSTWFAWDCQLEGVVYSVETFTL